MLHNCELVATYQNDDDKQHEEGKSGISSQKQYQASTSSVDSQRQQGLRHQQHQQPLKIHSNPCTPVTSHRSDNFMAELLIHHQ